MTNELSNGGGVPPSMNALTEPADPDELSTSSSAPAKRLAGQEVRLAPAQVDRRSGVIIFIGCIFGAAIAAVIAIPSYLSFFETPQQPTGDPIQLTSPDPVKSATPPMQNEAETPKLGANAWCSWRTCANRTSAAGAGQ
jgi:hypothetical protein